MPASRRQQRDRLDHRYFRTYQIADYAEGLATEPFAHLRELEAFVIDDALVPSRDRGSDGAPCTRSSPSWPTRSSPATATDRN